MDNLLDPRDQAVYDLGRATGAVGLIQGVWVYDRAVDIDGLRQFHGHLQRGRLPRRIEASPWPFGRCRWNSASGTSDIEIVATARPREELETWLCEQANVPLDCEHGPGWHLAALPFTDGGGAVSVVVSHSVSDGIGLCAALADAAVGRDNPIGWPAAESRTRWQAVREDARQTARDIPGIGRAVVAAVRLARRGGAVPGAATARRIAPTGPPAGGDEPITFSTVTMFVDADEWEARAHSLGGTSNALLAGLAARLAQRAGRDTVDGSVFLRMPVSDRATGDTRANAVRDVYVSIDPVTATTDLRETRAAIKQSLIRHGEVPDEEQALLSLVPVLPKRLVRVAPSAAGAVSSNLTVIDPAATRPDGTDADFFAVKLHYRGVTKAVAYRMGGELLFVSGQSCGQVFISAIAYQPGGLNSNDELRQNLSIALKDFSLNASGYL